jgi:hypothetical protein
MIKVFFDIRCKPPGSSVEKDVGRVGLGRVLIDAPVRLISASLRSPFCCQGPLRKDSEIFDLSAYRPRASRGGTIAKNLLENTCGVFNKNTCCLHSSLSIWSKENEQ